MLASKSLFASLDEKKERLVRLSRLSPGSASSLRESLNLQWTYHSNGIEGNTLTLRETKVVLEGITIAGRSLTEHLEAINHRDAIEFVERLIAEKSSLDQWQIKSIHSLVLRGIDAVEAGRYRRENVLISGASTTPPEFFRLDEEMSSLLNWYEQSEGLHPIERSAIFHARFVKIHPFIDGNGRTGRLLLNFDLMRNGYPPTILRKEDRLLYYDALDLACLKEDYSEILSLVCDAVERSLDDGLTVFESNLQGKEKDRTGNNDDSSLEDNFAPKG